MSKTVHRIYVYSLAAIVLFAIVYLGYKGYDYYETPLEERFYHSDHENFKPGGLYGHGLGIVGTLLMLVGVVMYIVRKRSRRMARWGRLKYWLEFHIFLCSLGPVMILFHTAFKFGGIISVAFWSMVAVVLSGVIGRFIYIQIPRSIEGRELSLNEISEMKSNVESVLRDTYALDSQNFTTMLATSTRGGVPGNLIGGMANRYVADLRIIRAARRELKGHSLSRQDMRKVIRLFKEELSLNNRIERLQVMQKLFKYWHVAHLPFALIMLVIVVLHVLVTLALGYTWIF